MYKILLVVWRMGELGTLLSIFTDLYESLKRREGKSREESFFEQYENYENALSKVVLTFVDLILLG